MLGHAVCSVSLPFLEVENGPLLQPHQMSCTLEGNICPALFLRGVQIKMNASFFASLRVRELEHWSHSSQGVPVGIVISDPQAA